MSPKTSKIKKESKDSKRSDSSIESRSAPSYETDYHSLTHQSYDDGVNEKVDKDVDDIDTLGIDMPELPKDESHNVQDEEAPDGEFKVMDYFDTFAKIFIKVLAKGVEPSIVFPMSVRKFAGNRGYFMPLRKISRMICNMVDDELARKGYIAYFACSPATDYGAAGDLRIASNDAAIAFDFSLNDRNYQDLLFGAYMENKVITLHVYIEEDILRFTKDPRFVDEPLKKSQAPTMFRGHPISLSDNNRADLKSSPYVTPNIKNGVSQCPTGNQFRNSQEKSRSPTSVYDDEDYLVKNVDMICTFGQQSKMNRVADLQTAAGVTIPDISTIPKLLKSHNVGYKVGDNAGTWYQRFNNFCLMIGIYLPPPNAMQKDSEMGREWDSKTLPFVFYSRFAKMEKVLTHIISSSKFFPDTMQDELQLNPKPYNFLRLFMALHSNSVPDLSDRIIKRPGQMKNSQTLSQYALAWVHYFNDEANVNGIEYSKFRQYCYFVDGISGKYSVIKKYLEMEFDRSHDRVNNIPITLELRNIPTTIASLCNIHGINVSSSQIHSLNESSIDDQDNCYEEKDSDASSIKKLHINKKNNGRESPSTSKTTKKTSMVQCWLCDGPHSFRQCNELTRMKTLCVRRPQVLKHFQQLLLQKEGVKVLMDASEFFEGSLADITDGEANTNNNSEAGTACDDKDQVNSLQTMHDNTFTTFANDVDSIHITRFPNARESNKQLTSIGEYDDDSTHQDFYVLTINESPSSDKDDVNMHSAQYDTMVKDIDTVLSMTSPYDNTSTSWSKEQGIEDFMISDSRDLHCDANSTVFFEHIRSVSFDSNTSSVRYKHFTTQVDGGADRCTTPHRTLVEDMRPPNPTLGEPEYIYDAGKHRHKVEGIGQFRIETWVNGKSTTTLTIPCAYIPSIPSTLVNFRLAKGAIMYGEIANLVTNEAIGTLIVGSPNHYTVHKIPLKLKGQRVYASNLLSSDARGSKSISKLDDREQVAIVSDEATRLLWHSRLGHLNFRSLSSMHLHATGVPKFKQSHVTDQCDTCLESKLRRSPRGHGSLIDKAEVHGQILCADWGFICQKSSDPTRITRLSSVHGDTSYLIFACAHTGALYGVCAGSKSVPTKWLHTFLHRISYSVGNRPKTVLVDRGSELGRSHQFKEIVELHGYKLTTSGPDKSSMNSLGERPHSTIGNALRSILHACRLELKYWNFAFYHFIRLFNFFPHGSRNKSPFELIRGKQPNLSLLRVFGCNVYIRPPGRRQSKLENHAIRGKFLGYTSTMKQIYYLEDHTNKIKIAAHARFDEGLSSVPLNELPPYARQLRKALGHSLPPADDINITPPDSLDLLSCSERFPVTFSYDFHVKTSDITNEYDTLGFVLKEDTVLRRCYISNICSRSTASQYSRWRSHLIGAFILSVNSTIVFHLDDTEAALSRCLVDHQSHEKPHIVTITFAHDRSLIRQDLDPDASIPSPIQMDQICHLSMIFETGEEIKYQPKLDSKWFEYFEELTGSLPTDDHITMIQESIDGSLYNNGAQEGEHVLKTSTTQFTRRQLKLRSEFDEWLAAEYKQLDTHHSDGMFGEPCPRPRRAIVLRSIWTYILKKDGTKKARNCGDGRPLRDDRFRQLESIYTACVSQVGVKIFFATAALLNYVIYVLDAINAFGQAGELFEMVYMDIDQQYRDWYLTRKGKKIPQGWVLPVKGSIQGHPDSGEVWQTRINEVIEAYGFQSTTHEPCLYRGTFKGHDLIICRQVDDMLMAGKDDNIVQAFAHELSTKLKITCGNVPSKQFNGIDIYQCREGIQINCFSYLEKLRKAHGWNETSSKPLEPISPSKVKELESTEGPNIDSDEGKLLAKRNGFNYRGIVGEIVYAYIAARPDYGFAVALLSRFNTCPAQCHYDAAKRCLKSLIRSANDGIWYWRREPRLDLPKSNFKARPLESFELKYPILKDPFLTSGMCDVSLAPNILMRRSMGATFVFLGGVALVMYVAKLQPTVVTSIGEGEFIQLVLTGKKVKHVRTVMNDLGFRQQSPSPIFGDNLSSIMMGNNVKPTDRTRHMDIKWFALQEWIHLDKDIILIHISGELNASDALSKALAWIKHNRHMMRAMGATGPVYLSHSNTFIPIESEAIKAFYVNSS